MPSRREFLNLFLDLARGSKAQGAVQRAGCEQAEIGLVITADRR